MEERSRGEEDDEQSLLWASLQKLPTYDRLRKGIFSTCRGPTTIGIDNLGFAERKHLFDRLLNVVEEDNEVFLLKLKKRLDRVGIDLPTIQVRFENLNVEAQARVGGRALPSLYNFYVGMVEDFLSHLCIICAQLSGIVTFNGHGMNEFIPQPTAAYISQHDLHIPEMTVRETLEFSARCQGVGSCYDMLTELLRREKASNIKPDPDIDIFMKVRITPF